MYLLGVLLMALGVAASIALHELGHLVPAKKFGVRTTQYMIGFGPTIWSRRRGETEYGFKAIPLGGYIRMIGMLPPRQDDGGRVRTSSTGRMSQLTDRAREDSFDEIREGDENRVFYKLPVWKKVVIMMGGPLMNLLIATVLLVGVACVIGLPQQTSARVAGVNECLPVTVAQGEKPPVCDPDNQSPAWKAGLKPGDVFVSVAGEPVRTTLEATSLINDNAGRETPVVVAREGKNVELTVTPEPREMPKRDERGVRVLTMTGQPVMEQVGMIGVSIQVGSKVTERRPLTQAPAIVGEGVKQTAAVFLRIPQKMVGVYYAAFGDGQRDLNGPVSVVGVGRVAGDVASAADSTGSVVVMLLTLLASLNLALFVFNMLPLLPLDGGHIAGALWEGIKRPIARARGVKGPVYADVTKALPLAYGVSIVLIVMAGLLIYADIVNPIRLN